MRSVAHKFEESVKTTTPLLYIQRCCLLSTPIIQAPYTWKRCVDAIVPLAKLPSTEKANKGPQILGFKLSPHCRFLILPP